MELIRINDNKLKIMLTSADMKNYALDAQALSCGTEETRRAFRCILHDAGAGDDFEEGQEKLYVQYYPSREGGCEMFVTKLAQLSEVKGKSELGMSAALPAPLGKKAPSVSLFYRYTSLTSLLQSCRVLLTVTPHLRAKLRSAAYRDEDNGFYLTVEPPSTPMVGEKSISQTLALLLGEFGVACPTQTTAAYIAEHASPLCRTHAIETLGKLC